MTSRLRVGLNNPGQVLAACGLFTIAAALRPHRGFLEAHFAADPHSDTAFFEMSCCHGNCGTDPLHEALRLLTDSTGGLSIEPFPPQTSPEPAGPQARNQPITLRAGEADYTLDWWIDPQRYRHPAHVTPIKTWSGQQNPLAILQHCLRSLRSSPEAFQDPEQLLYETRDLMLSSFYFDARLAYTLQRLGYSPDAVGRRLKAPPATELLAFVGLQLFRPSLAGKPVSNAEAIPLTYHTWHFPLALPVAAAVFCGAAYFPPVYTRKWLYRSVLRAPNRPYRMFTNAEE